MSRLINSLRLQMQQTLPGEEAQYRMAPLHRQRIEVETLQVEQYRPSAVMIVFCEDEDGELYIPLIERMSYNGAHSAQISLPGGKYDPKDLKHEQTALRECFEEIGISDIEVIGNLTKLFIPVSNFIVYPYLGVCRIKSPVMTIDKREVKTLLKLKVNDLMKEDTIERGNIELFSNLVIKTPWFNVEGHKVWGATAMILSELKAILKPIF